MASTPTSFSLASRSMLSGQGDVRPASEVRCSFGIGFLMAFACLTLVTIVVPERPNQLASICQQHNSTIACRVW